MSDEPITPDDIIDPAPAVVAPPPEPCADCAAMERRLYVAGAVSGVVVGALLFYIVVSRANG